MLSAVQSVIALKDAQKRIPAKWREVTYYSKYDLWSYINLGDPESECRYCLVYDGQVFAGNRLRSYFPDLKIEGPDDIYPNLHTTLWNKPTCKCRLVRLSPQGSLYYLAGEKKVFSGEPVELEKPKKKSE